MDTNSILLERAERALDEVLGHVRGALRDRRQGPFGGLMRGIEVAVLAALHALELKPRMREDVGILLELARRVHAGEEPAALAREHLDRVLRVRHLNLVVRVHDPVFAPVRTLAEAALAKRLPDLARMATVDEPKDYPDLVRKAFPERRAVDEIIDDNVALTMDVIAYAEKHPTLLRVPASWVPKVAFLARDVVDRDARAVRAEVDAIYDSARAAT